jgi:hypothetical protein
MTDRLADYVDVAERHAAFFAKYPDGRLRPHIPWSIRDVGGQMFLVYEAAAYREPDDKLPGIGTAWEPFPGTTPFTRNSELMNAETAAWGRAMVAVGVTASRKLATTNEIENRRAEEAAKPVDDPATQPQRRQIHALIAEKGVTRPRLANLLAPLQVELRHGWMDQLTKGPKGSASALIDRLRELPTPPEPASNPIPYGEPKT